MQRTNFLMKVITAVVFVAVLIYIGYYIYEANANPFTTTIAVKDTIETSFQTSGYAVRDEHVVSGGGTGVAIVANEGERISAGGTLAAKYSSQSAVSTASEIRELRLQIEQLESKLSGGQTASESVFELAYAVRSGNGHAIQDAVIKSKASIFDDAFRTDAELEGEIMSLRAELTVLQSRLGGTVEYITTDKAGIFSAVVDGYEHITISDFADITPGEYTALFSSRTAVSDRYIGKMIGNIKWYYITVLDKAEANLLTGKTATVAFTKTYSNTITMTIEDIGMEENGKCVVILSSTKYLSDITTVREMHGEIIFSQVSGIRTHKDSVHIDEEGVTYLYVLTGKQSARVNVKILGETGDYYVVEAVLDGTLRDGMEIITRANGLYDGKVVQ